MSARHQPLRYTVVQHSGFVDGRKRQFERGLEPATISTKAQQARVERVGGLLFDDWAQADEFCDKAMYPPVAETAPAGLDLIPRARGSFAVAKIGGLPVYIPIPEERVQ